MESIDFLRLIALCLFLAGVETLHGIARTVFLAPRLGRALAIKLSVISGSLLAFAVCYFLVPDIGASGVGGHLGLGLAISGFMAAFDVAIGRLVMRFTWSRILRDFDPGSGNYLSFGLAFLSVSPVMVWWLKGGAAF